MPLDKAPEPKWIDDPQVIYNDLVPVKLGHWECPQGYFLLEDHTNSYLDRSKKPSCFKPESEVWKWDITTAPCDSNHCTGSE